jgi:hypothetical protein
MNGLDELMSHKVGTDGDDQIRFCRPRPTREHDPRSFVPCSSGQSVTDAAVARDASARFFGVSDIGELIDARMAA